MSQAITVKSCQNEGDISKSNYPQSSWQIIVWAISHLSTLPTEAWALLLLNRWNRILVLVWVIPETPNLICIGAAQNYPPHLVHLHSSTDSSAKCCDLLPSNTGSARAVSFGETPLWQNTASSIVPPAAMFPLLIVWPTSLVCKKRGWGFGDKF